MFQEYYIVTYYNNTSLNENKELVSSPSVVVYHINACLTVENSEGQDYTMIYNTNTDASDEDYGTVGNLIEFVENGESISYLEGDSLQNVVDDYGNNLAYTFKVDNITNEKATIVR